MDILIEHKGGISGYIWYIDLLGQAVVDTLLMARLPSNIVGATDSVKMENVHNYCTGWAIAL